MSLCFALVLASVGPDEDSLCARELLSVEESPCSARNPTNASRRCLQPLAVFKHGGDEKKGGRRVSLVEELGEQTSRGEMKRDEAD